MKKINKVISGLILTVLLAIPFVSPVLASASNFAGTVGYDYAKVSSSNKKENDVRLSYFEWAYSDQGSHKLWLRVSNQGKKDSLGTKLTSLYVWGQIETNLTQGKYYDLYARREHIINPDTYVSGTWES